MSRTTSYTCDFSSQVREHPAIFTIDAGQEATGLHGIDACVKHIGQMVVTLLSKGIVKTLTVHVNGDVVEQLAKRSASGYTCDVPDCGFQGVNLQGLALHKSRAHNIKKGNKVNVRHSDPLHQAI